MKNNFFDISFDSSTGTVSSIVCPDDKTGMNWCISDGMWGYVESSSNGSLFENENHPMKLVSFEENDSIAKAVFSNGIIEADAKHFFADNGNLVESFTVKNLLFPYGGKSPILSCTHRRVQAQHVRCQV